MLEQFDKVIKFSHHYPKLHGQTFGKLVAIEYVRVQDTPEFRELLDYDTLYYEVDGAEGHYPIQYETNYMQLIFVGNKHIPFCTLRLMINPTRVEYYRSSVGRMFNFEFLDD